MISGGRGILGNYAHVQTVDTRPFLSEWEGPGYEANQLGAKLATKVFGATTWPSLGPKSILAVYYYLILKKNSKEKEFVICKGRMSKATGAKSSKRKS